jgi:hypothetical protein
LTKEPEEKRPLGRQVFSSVPCMLHTPSAHTPDLIILTISEDKMGRICSTNGEKRNAYRILVGKREENRPLGSPRRRYVDNITIDLRDIEWNDMDWIDLAQDRDQ